MVSNIMPNPGQCESCRPGLIGGENGSAGFNILFF